MGAMMGAWGHSLTIPTFTWDTGGMGEGETQIGLGVEMVPQGVSDFSLGQQGRVQRNEVSEDAKG